MAPGVIRPVISGTVLAGRYHVGRPIGEGGAGLVHAARDTVLTRQVALKILRAEAARRPGEADRFRSEARNAASLSHPNIAQVFDAGESGGVAYMAMEFVPGGTLADEIRAHGPLSPARAVAFALEVSDALSEAHKKSIVHRDIKPQNILVDERGHARVVDFGIAASLDVPDSAEDTEARSATVVGTAAYLSPEQASGLPPSPPSDLYSLGVVLYEMLAGRPPFVHQGGNELAVARMHLSEFPAPPGLYAPWISPELEDLVLRLLSKDPGSRYPSARALTRALDRNLAAALHWPASQTAPLPAPRRSPSRLRRFLGASAILLLLTAPGGAPAAGLLPDPVSDRVAEIGRNLSTVAADFYGRAGVVADGLSEGLHNLRTAPASATPLPEYGDETTGRGVPFADAPRDRPPDDSPEEPLAAPPTRFADDPRPASQDETPQRPQAVAQVDAVDAPSQQPAPAPKPFPKQTFDGAPTSTDR